MKRAVLSICILLVCLSCSQQDNGRISLLVVGEPLAPAAKKWAAAGFKVRTVSARSFPTDAASIARKCSVVVIGKEIPNDEGQAAIESFVRGGGGLLLSMQSDAPASPSSWLSTLSPSVAYDASPEPLTACAAAEGGPFVSMDFGDMPRLMNVFSTSIPDKSRLQHLSTLSPWLFAKPLWHSNWEEWLVSSSPGRLAIMSGSSYGAGRTAVFGGDIASRDLMAWPKYAELSKRIFDQLASAAAIVPVAPKTVVISGHPSSKSTETTNDFTALQEAFSEAGYATGLSGRPDAVVLMGSSATGEAKSRRQPNITVYAPSLEQPAPNRPFDTRSLKLLQQIRAAKLVEDNGSLTDILIPHMLPPLLDPAPELLGATPVAGVLIPDTWKVAFTLDTDSELDLAQKWFSPSFDDSGWLTTPLMPMTNGLFGQPAGYDGAIWYRGRVSIPAEATNNQSAALVLESAAQHLTVYVDGNEICLEPGKAIIPISAITAGEHLIAIRTYAEFRQNYGLLRAQAVYLPLLWKVDPDQAGFTEGWHLPRADESTWHPVNQSFGTDPAGSDGNEGWMRMKVNVRPGTLPFVATVSAWRNVETEVFSNGRLIQRRVSEPLSKCVIGTEQFHEGTNTLAIKARFRDMGQKGASISFAPRKTRLYRAQAVVDQDGLSLLARLRYDKNDFLPTDASIRVNGRLVGKYTGKGTLMPAVFAPNCLAKGTNLVEISVPAAYGETYGLQAIDIVKVPDSAGLMLTGWSQCPAATAPRDWFTSIGDDRKWAISPSVSVEDTDNQTTFLEVPNLGDPAFVYRTVIMLDSGMLDRNLTLHLDWNTVSEIFVNGTRITPDDRYFYSLNKALKPGWNLIAFAPHGSTYEGFNVMAPASSPYGSRVPELRSDRAPLIPAKPELASFTLNRTFKVTIPDTQPGDDTLFSWPNGTPAIVMRKADKRIEIRCAPGIFDEIHSGVSLDSKQELLARTFSVSHRLDGIEQLLPCLIDYAAGQPAHLGSLEIGVATNALLTIASNDSTFKGTALWRAQDVQGRWLFSGSTPFTNSVDSPSKILIPLSRGSTSDSSIDQSMLLRIALLDEKGRVVSALSRMVTPLAPVDVALRLPAKNPVQGSQPAATGRTFPRGSSDAIEERFVFAPGEACVLSAYLRNNAATQRKTVLRIAAVGGLNGKRVDVVRDIILAPWQRKIETISLSGSDTMEEQPWSVTAEVLFAGEVTARSSRSIAIMRPRARLERIESLTCQGRVSAAYRDSIFPHALPIEHLLGVDALPAAGAPGDSASRFRYDGNWLVAQGAQAEPEHGLLWGPFFDQGSCESMNTHGWFPNGQSIRQWWSPYSTREPLRQHGRRSVLLDLAGDWGYDTGFQLANYATLANFHVWAKTSNGRYMAGPAVFEVKLNSPTLSGNMDIAQRDCAPQLQYFMNESFLNSAAYTRSQFTQVAPGSVQQDYGSFLSHLPACMGGISLGQSWAEAVPLTRAMPEATPDVGHSGLALEMAALRAIGTSNFVTHTGSPNIASGDSRRVNRHLLHMLWQVIRVRHAVCEPVVNTARRSEWQDVSELSWVDEKLSSLAMNIAVQRPLSPLLLVGENAVPVREMCQTIATYRDNGLQIGGAVSIAALSELRPDDIPGIVWVPAAKVHDWILADLTKLINAGVPILIVGNIPTSASADVINLFQLLGITRAAGKSPQSPQQVLEPKAIEWQKNINASIPADYPIVASEYALTGNGMYPLVSRSGRTALSYLNAVNARVVFDATQASDIQQEDPMVMHMALRAFKEVAALPVTYPEGTTGYAFVGKDDNVYIVVQNLRQQKQDAHVELSLPLLSKLNAAADLVNGQMLGLKASASGATLIVPLEAGGGTIAVLKRRATSL